MLGTSPEIRTKKSYLTRKACTSSQKAGFRISGTFILKGHNLRINHIKASRIERLVNHGIPGTINTQSKGATRCGFTLVGLKDDALETTIVEVIVQNLITAIAHGDET